MIRVLFIVISISLFIGGGWSILQSSNWPTKENPDWKSTTGWITEISDGYERDKDPNPAEFMLSDKHVSYVYFVEGKMYFKDLNLPVNVYPFRVGIKTLIPHYRVNPFDAPNAPLAAARFNAKFNRLEVVTNPGLVASVDGMARRSQVKYKTVTKPEELNHYLNAIKVVYNPEDPYQSITDPDILDGNTVLMRSGIILIVLGIVVIGGIIFHMSVTKEQKIPDPFENRRGQTYR